MSSMYVIVGASSGVGRALAEKFSAKGSDLILVSREERDTCAMASDLMLRFGVSVKSVKQDLAASQPDFTKILEFVDAAGEDFKGILFPVGAVIDKDALAMEASAIDGLFRVNCLSICQLITEVLTRAHKDCDLSIVGFGSIASARGRGSNMIYSAAKRALQFYFEGLRHACVGESIVIQFYVLGYMDTNLAFANNVPLFKGAPNVLAEKVYRDIHKDTGVRFFPHFWGIIALIIKLVPWRIYKHMKF
jgi:short-subunit dehydrogenase